MLCLQRQHAWGILQWHDTWQYDSVYLIFIIYYLSIIQCLQREHAWRVLRILDWRILSLLWILLFMLCINICSCSWDACLTQYTVRWRVVIGCVRSIRRRRLPWTKHMKGIDLLASSMKPSKCNILKHVDSSADDPHTILLRALQWNLYTLSVRPTDYVRSRDIKYYIGTILTDEYKESMN
jgi:hypothetical protein